MFARYLMGACAIGLLALHNAPATAQERPRDYHRALSAACGKEIQSHCSGVQDARGELVACLYAHQTNLSPRCEGIVWSTMDRLGKALGKVENVLRDCDVDARQWCKETVSGGGNLVSCFLISRLVMSPRCKAAIYRVWDGKGRRG